MFYRNFGLNEPADEGASWAIVVLTPSESKRLIGKAVAAMPEVKKAYAGGRMIISEGTTNAYVVEELLGQPLASEAYACGAICGGLSAVPTEARVMPYLFHNGRPVDERSDEEQRRKAEVYEEDADHFHPKTNWELHEELIKDFEADDVLIKGATAVDQWGNAGVFIAEGDGGSIGRDLPVVLARGAHLIVPVGLEKLVPSVAEASRNCSIMRFKHSFGFCPAVMPLINAKVVTEVQALRILTGVTAYHVGAGGVGGSEGAVVLSLAGPEKAVDQAFELVKSIKGEPPTPKPELIPDIPPEMRFVRFIPFKWD